MADLLEDLGRAERRELVAALDIDVAADGLDEMNAPDVLGDKSWFGHGCDGATTRCLTTRHPASRA